MTDSDDDSGPSLVENASLANRAVHGVGWVFSITATTTVLQLCVLAVLARVLGPREFGLVGAALIVVQFAQLCSQLGMGPAIVQHRDLSHSHLRVATTLSVLLGCLTGALLSLTAGDIALFFRMPELHPILRALAVVFPVTAVAAVSEALLQREMKFRTLSLIDMASYAFGFGACGVILAKAGWGVWALVAAQVAQGVLRTALLLIAAPVDMRPLLSEREARELLGFGGGLSLARLGNALALQVDNLVVARWIGADALGIYGRVYQSLAMPANLLGGAVDKVLFPTMATIQSDGVRLARAYRGAIRLLGVTTLPLSALLILLAPEIVLLLLGSQWSAAVLPFRVMATATFFRAGYKVSDSLVRAKGVVYRSAWRQFAYAVAVFTGAWVGHFWGLPGVAAGVATAIVIHYVTMLYLSVVVTGMQWFPVIELHLRQLALAAVAAVVAAVTAASSRALGLSAGGVVLLTVAVVTGAGLLVLYFTPRHLGVEVLWLIREWKARASR